MIKKSFLLGAIVSIITTNAIANQVITSQTYVDNADALKVNIAQGVGTNNANVGKTLVVNSQGNLELGTVSADNFVEDSITDGVTNKAPSENAVHDALDEVYDELDYKQNAINADNWNPGDPAEQNYVTETLVTYNLDNDEVGASSYGIATPEAFTHATWHDYVSPGQGFVSLIDLGEGNPNLANTMPTTVAVAEALKYLNDRIPRLPGGTANTVVMYNNSGAIGGSRAIYDGSATYNSGTHSTYIPTMGAVMSAISNNTPTLPTGTANTVVMYNNSGAIGGSRAIYDGSTTYNATNDAAKLVTANGVSKMKECTRWIDNAAHTDENCLLWRLP